MHDQTTGEWIRPSETWVMTEVVLFGPDRTRHVVTVGAGEFDRLRLFGMRPTKGLGRHQDRTNDLLYMVETKATFDADPFPNDIPVVEHASLADFFKAIGYSFSRNRYAVRADTTTAGQPLAA